ncbi:hypothetical protein MYXO_01882 [Myxococcaceae bacterium]|nr:hypothetical protein MYXO_01882 [Myxococcaceae bacterium]
MASYDAIGAVSMTLAGLIRDRYPRAEFGTAEVDLYQAASFHHPMKNGFSIYLYRVAVNGTVRNMSCRTTPDGRRFRPSLPLDLYYLITPWAEDTERQLRMLGWVMRFLEDQGTLSASHLNHYVAETDIFTPNESIDIVCDPLTLNDYLTLWDRLRTLPASASYALRMVLVDSTLSVDEGPPVQTRTFGIGEVVS